MITAAFILQDKPVRFSCGNFHKNTAISGRALILGSETHCLFLFLLGRSLDFICKKLNAFVQFICIL